MGGDTNELSILLTELERLASRREGYATSAASIVASLLIIAGSVTVSDPQLPDVLWVLVPLVPIGFYGHAVRQMRLRILHSYYERVVEQRIWALGPSEATESGIFGEPAGLRIPALAHMNAVALSTHTGSWTVRMNGVLYNLAVFLLAAGATFLPVQRISSVGATVVAGIVYGAILALQLGEIAAITLGGRTLWRRAVERLVGVGNDTERRGLFREQLQFLLLPRPRGFWIRGMAFAIAPGIAAGVLLGVSSLHGWALLAGGLAALELLWIQGRYLLNDVLGWEEDAAATTVRTHVRAADLFSGSTRNRLSLGAYALLRSGAGAVALVLLARTLARGAEAAGGLLVSLLAWVAYEVARNRRQLPSGSRWSTRAIAAVVLVVALGVGYGARVWLATTVLTMDTRSMIAWAVSAGAIGGWAVLVRWGLHDHGYVLPIPSALAAGDRSMPRGVRLTSAGKSSLTVVAIVILVTLVLGFVAHWKSLATLALSLIVAAVLGTALLVLTRNASLVAVLGAISVSTIVLIQLESAGLCETPCVLAVVPLAWLVFVPLAVCRAPQAPSPLNPSE